MSDVNESFIFSTGFRKIVKYKNFMKIHPVGAELFHADRHDEASSRFPQRASIRYILAIITVRKVLRIIIQWYAGALRVLVHRMEMFIKIVETCTAHHIL